MPAGCSASCRKVYGSLAAGMSRPASREPDVRSLWKWGRGRHWPPSALPEPLWMPGASGGCWWSPRSQSSGYGRRSSGNLRISPTALWCFRGTAAGSGIRCGTWQGLPCRWLWWITRAHGGWRKTWGHGGQTWSLRTRGIRSRPITFPPAGRCTGWGRRQDTGCCLRVRWSRTRLWTYSASTSS